ncbi:uncharacterized protein LOC131869370 [Cryptomeria japonica]|uniref:uncharacterized protein LOC131869370 n=1 Tax=Cryptomeria japonica TaxID=3369 RepID=UPI0027DA332A|nr:uncharacterized protein LOC131869370 [Cryptomeria japonica]
MEDAEAQEVIDNLNKQLEEKRQRLMEMESEEEMLENEPEDTEAISRSQAKDVEEYFNEDDQIVTKVEIYKDARLDGHASFVADDVFVKSKEFKSFLNNFKDKRKNYDLEGYIQSCKKSQNLGGYLHVSIEAEDIFKNMDDAEAKEVIDQLNNELVEKRRRLEEIETKEEEAESEFDENVVVSRWQVPEKEEEADMQGQIETTLEVHADSCYNPYRCF